MGHWIHALCVDDPRDHLEGLEEHLRALRVEGDATLGDALRIEGGPTLPPPFHLDWLEVFLPDERAPGLDQSFVVSRAEEVEAETQEFLGLLGSGRYGLNSEAGLKEVGEALLRTRHVLSIRLGEGQSATSARVVARAAALWFAGETGGLALDGDHWFAPPDGVAIR